MTAPSTLTDGYQHPDEARMAAFRRVYNDYRVADDIYAGMAERFLAAGVTTFAEVGGGRGPIAAELSLHGVATYVIDRDETMLSETHGPAVRGDLTALPARDAAFDGVAAVNCFYFLADPLIGIREAWRILRPGGLFVASSPSRWNDPELRGLDPNWGTASSFDAEESPALVAEVFGDVEIDAAAVVAYVLPTNAAIADYLHAFNVAGWAEKAEAIKPPMTITKVGAQVWARR